jgi:hypothetical protein
MLIGRSISALPSISVPRHSDHAPNFGLQPTRPAAFLPSKLCHHRVAGRAAEPRSVGRRRHRMNPEVRALFPDLVGELRELLTDSADSHLAEQLSDLVIVDRCRCGDDFCGMFYTIPPPEGAWPSPHRNVPFFTEHGELILDVVNERIAAIEVLYRPEVRRVLDEVMP